MRQSDLGRERKELATRKNIFLILVTTFGIKENEYSRELLENTIEIADLFTD